MVTTFKQNEKKNWGKCLGLPVTGYGSALKIPPFLHFYAGLASVSNKYNFYIFRSQCVPEYIVLLFVYLFIYLFIYLFFTLCCCPLFSFSVRPWFRQLPFRMWTTREFAYWTDTDSNKKKCINYLNGILNLGCVLTNLVSFAVVVVVSSRNALRRDQTKQ